MICPRIRRAVGNSPVAGRRSAWLRSAQRCGAAVRCWIDLIGMFGLKEEDHDVAQAGVRRLRAHCDSGVSYSNDGAGRRPDHSTPGRQCRLYDLDQQRARVRPLHHSQWPGARPRRLHVGTRPLLSLDRSRDVGDVDSQVSVGISGGDTRDEGLTARAGSGRSVSRRYRSPSCSDSGGRSTGGGVACEQSRGHAPDPRLSKTPCTERSHLFGGRGVLGILGPNGAERRLCCSAWQLPHHLRRARFVSSG